MGRMAAPEANEITDLLADVKQGGTRAEREAPGAAMLQLDAA